MTARILLELFAVKPPRGRVVHLHSPGYQPSEKPRPHADISSMCGAPIWPNGTPTMEHQLAPLADAMKWTSLAPSSTDPRPSWRWCRPCIGHVVEVYGMQRDVLTEALARGVPS